MELPWSTRMTLVEFEQLPDDNMRYEVLEGELVMSPAPGFRHQKTLGLLHVLLMKWHAAAPARGEVLLAPFDVILALDTIVEPDLIWVAEEQRSRFQKGRLNGPPDLAVEIFRTQGAARDRVVKLQIYAKFGVREYWLVDLDARSIVMLELVGEKYVPFAEGTGEDQLSSRALDGLSIRPQDVIAEE